MTKPSDINVEHAGHEVIEDKLLIALSDDSKVAAIFTEEDIKTLLDNLHPRTREAAEMYQGLTTLAHGAFGAAPKYTPEEIDDFMNDTELTKEEQAAVDNMSPDKVLEKMDLDRVKTLFHRAWGDAHGSPDYNKEVWRQLREALFAVGVQI